MHRAQLDSARVAVCVAVQGERMPRFATVPGREPTVSLRRRYPTTVPSWTRLRNAGWSRASWLRSDVRRVACMCDERQRRVRDRVPQDAEIRLICSSIPGYWLPAHIATGQT